MKNGEPSVMRKTMKKTFACLVVVFVLAGCCSQPPASEKQEGSPDAENVDSTKHDAFFAMLNTPTDVSELTPHKLEGKLIYYLGDSTQNPAPVSEAEFDRIAPEMTIGRLVDALGPGFSRSDWGLAFISWYCEDGRELHVHMNINRLNQIPKIYKHKKEKDS